MGRLSKLIGNQKEQKAADFLIARGIKLLKQNFHCKGGEIDLICLDTTTSNPVLVFVEVKHRQTTAYGRPEEAVTPSKQRKLILCAQTFLQKHPKYQNYEMRFDTLAFIADQTEPNWIPNAFWLE